MSTRPVVAIGVLGGTITMTRGEREAGGAGSPGVVPRLEAAELVAAVPGLTAVADVRAHTLALLPGASLGVPDLARALDWAGSEVAAGATGVVLVQGTDTLEETAYHLDLWWPHPQPLVVTGAMRAPEAAGADGPANLVAAVTTAADPVAAGRGVLVVLDDEVHAAARVAKADSMALSAFRSPVFGPLARLVEGRPAFATPAVRPPALELPPEWSPWPRVALVTTHLGDDGRLLELAVEDGYDGVVLAAAGAGHVSAAAAQVVGRVAPRVPVVVATRTGAGPTATDTYGFVGSEQDLRRRGALSAGWLPPVKARVLLAALLHLGRDRDAIRTELARRGAAGWS